MRKYLFTPILTGKWKHILIAGFMLTFLFGKTVAQSNCTPIYFAPSEVISNVAEAADYSLAYQLDIPATGQHWVNPSDVPYTINNTPVLSAYPFSRVAYYMQLSTPGGGLQWVWVSFDAFTTDMTKIGIPTGSTVWQQIVNNMNVRDYQGSSQDGISGNIEFWPNCYGQNNAAAIPGANDFAYDFGDATLPIDQSCSGYGSFQVHDYAGAKTLFAYNGWAYDGGDEDLGIGNQPGGDPDWTLAQNSSGYSIRTLYVLVKASCCNGTLAATATAPPIPCGSTTTTVTVSATGGTAPYTGTGTFTRGPGTWNFNVTDNAGCSTTATVTIAEPANCGGHFYHTTVSCSGFLAGSTGLANVCYASSNGTVTNSTPGMFFYYTKITSPVNGSFTVDVVQTKGCNGFKFFNIHQGNQLLVFNGSCTKVATGVQINSSTGRVTINNATIGQQFVISVKYNVKSIIGSTYAGAAPTCQYDFVCKIGGNAVNGTAGSINVVPGCSVPEPRVMISSNDIEEMQPIGITALPNPSASYFSIRINNGDNSPAEVRITDVYGKLIQVNNKVNAGSTLQVGQSWSKGVYFAEIRQGGKKSLVKLVKID